MPCDTSQGSRPFTRRPTPCDIPRTGWTRKRLFDELEIPLPGYHAIDTREDLDEPPKQLGLPMVIKTRRFGYDGKGQFVVRNADLDAAWAALGDQALIAEQWVAFD